MKIKYKVWLECENGVVFGQGRRELLETIDEYRSLNAAAKKMQMSYRASWGRLKASEERLGIKLVDHEPGEALHLTKTGRTLLEEFKQLEEELGKLIEKANAKMKLFDNIDCKETSCDDS